MASRFKQVARDAVRRLGLLDTYYLLRAARPYDLISHRLHRGERFEIPGPALRVSTAGTADLAWFLETGGLAAWTLREAVGLSGHQLGEMEWVLDFGCGCGRVLRRLAAAPGPALYGADIHRAAVDWCARFLPVAQVLRNGLEPSLEFPADHFDLIYAFSVFTHLPPDLAERWMDELARMLKPGGILVLSTHGDSYRGELSTEELAAFDAGQVVVRAAAAAGSNACGVYHPPAFVETQLGRGLEFLRLVPEGAEGNPRQDLSVFRRR